MLVLVGKAFWYEAFPVLMVPVVPLSSGGRAPDVAVRQIFEQAAVIGVATPHTTCREEPGTPGFVVPTWSTGLIGPNAHVKRVQRALK